MKQLLFFLFFIGAAPITYLTAQQITLKKGVIIDSVRVNDSVPESYSLYLPTNFESSGKWPVIFVFDMHGKGKQTLGLFKQAAEDEGYILAASNDVNDTISISDNLLITSRMMSGVSALFPVHTDRLYTAGFRSGARIASVVPSFISNVRGVISCGAPIPNVELLNSKKPFHFIGIVGKEDFNYPEMLKLEKLLNKMNFPNQLLLIDGGHEWPNPKYLQKAMQIFTLAAMAKGNVSKNASYIDETFEENLSEVGELLDAKKMLDAYERLKEVISVYRVHVNVDSLNEKRKQLKKDKLYRLQRRNENTYFLKESFIKDDYQFSLTEDVATLNYNNLGWWNYQMGELKKYERSANIEEKRMGKRLIAYLNALIEDNIDIEEAQTSVNGEAVIFLWMLKTITDPLNYSYYLKIISDSAKYEDFGTALFYLEELLKNGYKDKTELYSLENTALLRITPEFNNIVEKYLKDARYEIIEE